MPLSLQAGDDYAQPSHAVLVQLMNLKASADGAFKTKLISAGMGLSSVFPIFAS